MFQRIKDFLTSLGQDKLHFHREEYAARFRDKIFVVKYGGSALSDEEKNFYSLMEDLVYLKKQGIRVILMHGGSKHLNSLLKQHQVESRASHGIRITTEEILGHAIEAFGQVNAKLVNEINNKGKKDGIYAVGIRGDLDRISTSTFLNRDEFQFVGEIQQVHSDLLSALDDKAIPVISSISRDAEGQPLNVNADTYAAVLARELKAEKLVMITNTDGILDENGELIHSITEPEILELIERGVIKDGMTAKVRACLDALDHGTGKVHFINGTRDHSLMKEIFTDEGVGTEIIH